MCTRLPRPQGEKGLSHRLVHIDEPLLKIPNICIHLSREMNTSFSFNKETQMYVSIPRKLPFCPELYMSRPASVYAQISLHPFRVPIMATQTFEKLQTEATKSKVSPTFSVVMY